MAKTIQNPPVISTRKRLIAPRVTTRSTTRPRRPPPSVRGIHLDGTRLDLDPDPREEHAVSSSLIRCNWQGLRPWNLPFQAIVQRGEEDYPGGGQERVTCPRHLQFFFSCPGEMPSRASHRPVREKWSKNFLEIDRTRLLRLSGHGWYVHHRVVDKLSSYRPLTGHIFSPPFKYFLQRIRNSRIIPFFLLSLIQLIFFFYLIICLSESEGGILKIDIVNYYYFHFEEKLDFTRTRYPR